MPKVHKSAHTGVTGNQDDVVSARGSDLRLMGYSARESAGTAAAAGGAIKDASTGASGDAAAFFEFPNGNESDTQWFGEDGIAMNDGISIEHDTGTFDVTVYYRVG